MEQELLQMALRAYDNNNYSLSITLGEKLITEYNSPSGFFVLGLVHTVLEDWDLGYKYCYETYKYFPQIPDNLNRLGVSLCHLGNIEEGLEYFKKGIDLGDEYCKQNYGYWINRL